MDGINAKKKKFNVGEIVGKLVGFLGIFDGDFDGVFVGDFVGVIFGLFEDDIVYVCHLVHHHYDILHLAIYNIQKTIIKMHSNKQITIHKINYKIVKCFQNQINPYKNINKPNFNNFCFILFIFNNITFGIFI